MNRDKLEQELTRFENEVLSGLERPPIPSQQFRLNNIPPPLPVPSYQFHSNTNPPLPPPPSITNSFEAKMIAPAPPPPPSAPHNIPHTQTYIQPNNSATKTEQFHPPPPNAILRPNIIPYNPIPHNTTIPPPNNLIPPNQSLLPNIDNALPHPNSNVPAPSFQPTFTPYRPPIIQQVVPQPYITSQPLPLPVQNPAYCLPNPQIPLIPTHIKPLPIPPFTPAPVQANKSDTNTGNKKIEGATPSKESIGATSSGGVVSVKKKSLKKLDKKQKKLLRAAAGQVWYDDSMEEWDSEDYRIFCGDLGNEVNDEILYRAFSQFKSLQKVRVIRDGRSHKSKGYGFVSFKDPKDFLSALKEVNGKYIGNRPVKLRKSVWRERSFEVVRKKTIEKKKLGLR